MNWREITMQMSDELRSVGERIAENPKTTAAASVFTTAAGVASFEQWLTGIGSQLAIYGGLFGVMVLARLNWLKGETEKERRKFEQERRLLNRMKAKEFGVDLDKEIEADNDTATTLPDRHPPSA